MILDGSAGLPVTAWTTPEQASSRRRGRSASLRAKIYNETRAKPDAYFSEMLGKDDNGAMRAITRDYVFTKPFQADETTPQDRRGAAARLRVASARNDTGLLAAVPRRERAFDDAHDA